MVSPFVIRSTLPLCVAPCSSRSSTAAPVFSPTILSVRILPIQSDRRRGILSSSFTIRALGDMTAVPSSITERVSSNLTESENTTLSEEQSKDDKGNKNDGSDSGKISNSKMVKVCDKLIGVFLVDKPTTTDWRRLLAFSREWNNIRPHFYKRCQERADSESDPGRKHKLLRLSRKLKEVDDDVQRHDELLQVIIKTPDNIGSIVAKRRKDFTKEFFVHLHTVAESYYADPEKQNEVARLGNVCIAAVQSYDNASESIEALNAAELKLNDILNSPTLDAACRKIDNLAEKKELDSALTLMLTKAWSTAKESNLMKDEAKDILYHLYKTAVGNLQRLMPKEVRILKYLLTIEDPEERLSALRDAFTPGNELEGENVDCLYTTPEVLYSLINTVVDAYLFSREGTLVKEARDLMNPKIIQRLEQLKKEVQDKFL